MNLIQIEYFVEVAKQLNFTKAAKNLKISQPALSNQIKLIEKELNLKLLERNKRCVNLTEEGSLILKECIKIQNQLNNMTTIAQYFNRNQSRTIKVGCLNGLDTEEFFINTIKNFHEFHHNFNINIEIYDFKDLRDKLDEDSLDIIFTLSFEIENFDNISYKVIKERNISLFISKDHPLSKNNKLCLHDLKDSPFIVIDKENSLFANKYILKKLSQYNFTPKKVINVPNLDTLLNSIELGFGFSLLDKKLLDKRNCNIKYFEIPKGEKVYNVVAMWKNNKNPIISYFLSSVP